MPKLNPPTGDPIIDALKAERERQGLTQQDLAEKIGRLRGRSICHWESGVRSPTLDNLREWTGALGKAVALVDAEPEREP